MRHLKYIPVILFGLLLQHNINAQTKVLENYIKTGIDNNLALKQKHNSYEKSLEALREAKGLFYPDISLNARYSISEGGRTFVLPIGDLMNPVYSTLNGITSAMALSGQIPPTGIFPDTSINNELINFLRPTEHETKLRLVQPIVNTQIWNNYKIKQELINVQKADVDTYRRQLVADIKSAYFSYLKTIELIELLENTTILVNENYRVNQKLFDNHKVTYDIVLRAKAEISKIDQQKAEAEKNNHMAAAYFNFLLNRPLNEEIESTKWEEIKLNSFDIESASNSALNKREELQATSIYSKVADYNINMNKQTKLPTITAVVDYGLQGETYDFNNIDDQDYMMASFILKWDLFKGFQNQSKTQQAIIDKQIIEKQHHALQDQIKLQVINAYYELEASHKLIIASENEIESLQKAFNLVNKKYIIGKVNLLEFIDARTSMTNAQHKLIIAKYDYFIKLAEFEKVTASYLFNE